jgi:hypothetical protein
MTSSIKLGYFHGPSAADDFNSWSEGNPKVEVKELRSNVITEGVNDGYIWILVIYQESSNIISADFTIKANP